MIKLEPYFTFRKINTEPYYKYVVDMIIYLKEKNPTQEDLYIQQNPTLREKTHFFGQRTGVKL